MITRDEILAMEPGRKLDNEVAITVLGVYTHAFDGKGELWTCEMKPSPHYSTDISAAWEVVEKMQTWGGCDIGCYGRPGDGAWYVVDTHAPNGHHKVTCRTAPEAICKAALLAVIDA